MQSARRQFRANIRHIIELPAPGGKRRLDRLRLARRKENARLCLAALAAYGRHDRRRRETDRARTRPHQRSGADLGNRGAAQRRTNPGMSCSTSNMSVLEGSLGILPRRILVRDDDIQDGAPAAARGCGPRPRACVPSQAERADRRHRRRGARRRAASCASQYAAIASATTRSCSRQQRERGRRDHAVDLGAGVGAAGLALASPRCRADDRHACVELDPALCGARG